MQIQALKANLHGIRRRSKAEQQQHRPTEDKSDFDSAWSSAKDAPADDGRAANTPAAAVQVKKESKREIATNKAKTSLESNKAAKAHTTQDKAQAQVVPVIQVKKEPNKRETMLETKAAQPVDSVPRKSKETSKAPPPEKHHRRRTTGTSCSTSIQESTEAAPPPQAQKRSPTLSRRRSSKTIDSANSDTCPSICPNDGAGHGLRALKRQTSIPRNYEIRDIPKNLRGSDLSTDSVGGSRGDCLVAGGDDVNDVMVATRGDGGGGRTKRHNSAPRMVASERLALRSGGIEGNRKRNDSWDGLIHYAQSAQMGARCAPAGRGGEKKSDNAKNAGGTNRASFEVDADSENDDDVSGCWLNDCKPLQGATNTQNQPSRNDRPSPRQRRKQQSCNKEEPEPKQPGPTATDAILADYIQLKMQIAELQSKLQHQALESNSKIEELQYQNSLLLKENFELSERNRTLMEEKERLDQSQHSLFSICRRMSLQEELGPRCVPRGGKSWLRFPVVDDVKTDETDEETSKRRQSWGFLPLFGDGRGDGMGEVVLTKKRDGTRTRSAEEDEELLPKVSTDSSAAPAQQTPAPLKVGPVRRRSSLSAFRPELQHQDSSNDNKTASSNDGPRDQAQREATKTIKATNSPRYSNEACTNCIHAEPSSNVSIGETSCETAPSVVCPEQALPAEDPRSRTGDPLCFSILADSVNSEYEEFSVVCGL